MWCISEASRDAKQDLSAVCGFTIISCFYFRKTGYQTKSDIDKDGNTCFPALSVSDILF